jgi:hypothetical protein
LTAGPSSTAPSVAKRDPWQGQSHERSAALKATWQYWCVQSGETACTTPSSSRKAATLSPSTLTMPPSPGASWSSDGTSGDASRSPKKCAPTLRPSLSRFEAEASGLKRFASNVAAHGFSIPPIASASISAAAAALVKPHFLKPLAVHTWREIGESFPT